MQFGVRQYTTILPLTGCTFGKPASNVVMLEASKNIVLK
jgi:hypothetical protein